MANSVKILRLAGTAIPRGDDTLVFNLCQLSLNCHNYTHPPGRFFVWSRRSGRNTPTSMAPLRPGRDILVQAFHRFDATLSRVENTHRSRQRKSAVTPGATLHP